MQSEDWSPGPGPDPVDLDSPELENKSVEIGPGLVQAVPPSPDHVLSMLPASSCSSLNGLEPFCRICHEGGGAAELVSPCVCAGTVGAVHRVCLEHWLTASSTRRCELCHHEFTLERLPKPLTEWLATPSTQQQRRTLCGDVICFLFITSLAGLSGWLCVQGAADLFYSNGLEACALLLLTFALFTIYFFWTMTLIYFQWRRMDPGVSSLQYTQRFTPSPSAAVTSSHLQSSRGRHYSTKASQNTVSRTRVSPAPRTQGAGI